MAVFLQELVKFILGDIELKNSFFLLARDDFSINFRSKIYNGVWFEAGSGEALPVIIYFF